jgi:acyl-CoA reductase-like NAD-dependent aldehyde dehydrogenase
MIITGQQVTATSGKYFDVLNPGTEEVIAQVLLGDREDARRAIDAARAAFNSGILVGQEPLRAVASSTKDSRPFGGEY